MRISTIRNKLLTAAFWLLVWQIIAIAVGKEVLVPSPYRTLLCVIEMIRTGTFYLDAAATILRCAAGIILSFAVGVLTAILSYRSAFVRELLSFPVLVFKSTPVIGIILFLILLLASGQVPVCVCFLMCYPVVYTNILSGLDNLDGEQLEMVRMYKVKSSLIIRRLYIPSVMPEIAASLNLIAGLSWKTVVTAEVFAVPSFSMGYNLLSAKSYLETDRLFAWIIAIVLFSIAFEKVIQKGLSILSPREYTGSRIIKTPLRDTEASGEPAPRTAVEIELAGVCKTFGEKTVLENADLRFKGGKTTVLMGPSGVGKTTVLRIVAGLERCDSGEVRGTSGQQISFLFQEDRLLPWLSLYDNIALVLKGRLAPREIDGEIRKALDFLALSDSAQKLPPQLSGGMKRRAAMARAFLFPAQILLLDEPYKGLDRELKDSVATAMLRDYTAGKTVILVTHDPEEAAKYADETVRL